MSFKTDLQSNNIDLQTILTMVNELPESGSGGSGGINTNTCNVTVNITYGSSDWHLYYVAGLDDNGNYIYNNITTKNGSYTIHPLCESLIFTDLIGILSATDGVVLYGSGSGTSIIYKNSSTPNANVVLNLEGD